MKNKIISVLLNFALLANLFAAPYSGTMYGGTLVEPKIYDGTEVYPFVVDGKELYPISNSGSLIDGIYYEGINLIESKLTVHTITGHEHDSDFFLKSVPQQYKIKWSKVIGKYAVGTTVIVLTGIVTLVTGAETGFIAAASFEGAVEGAVVGTVTDALISGTLSALKGNPKEQVFKEAIEASADGFMWGAITGAVTGGIKGAKQLTKGTPVLNSKGKIINLVNENNEVIIAKTGKVIPGSKVLPKSESGIPKYYSVGNKLYDFDNNLICDAFKIRDGMVFNINKQNQLFGYIDASGILHTEEKAIIAAIRKEWTSVLGSHIEGSYEFLKLGKNGSGKILKYNYSMYYGETIPKFAQGHHIVPSNIDGDGRLCRLVFEKFGIDINDPHNCVLLADDALSTR